MNELNKNWTSKFKRPPAIFVLLKKTLHKHKLSIFIIRQKQKTHIYIEELLSPADIEPTPLQY